MLQKERFATTLDVYVRGRLAKSLTPEKNFHWNIEQWVSEVAVWSRLNEDLYIALGGLSDDGLATYQIMREPLMIWMWIGGFVLVLGTLVAWWPASARRSPWATGHQRRKDRTIRYDDRSLCGNGIDHPRRPGVSAVGAGRRRLWIPGPQNEPGLRARLRCGAAIAAGSWKRMSGFARAVARRPASAAPIVAALWMATNYSALAVA